MIQLLFSNDKRISALYFALLQSGYEYFKLGRDDAHVQALQRFIGEDVPEFFAHVKQTDCDVYPYWPRAAILECAALQFSNNRMDYHDFFSFWQSVEQAPNLTIEQRSHELRDWLGGFPKALEQVFQSDLFVKYYTWECELSLRSFSDRIQSLNELQQLLTACAEQFNSTIKCIKIIHSPIKCVYSADCHLDGDCLIIISGAFDQSTVVHEYLHTVVHPLVQAFADEIPNDFCADLDNSYFLSGKCYAFEEYAVRQLSESVIAGHIPVDLPAFLKGLIAI